VLEPLES
jgi:hypothetical protein